MPDNEQQPPKPEPLSERALLQQPHARFSTPSPLTTLSPSERALLQQPHARFSTP